MNNIPEWIIKRWWESKEPEQLFLSDLTLVDSKYEHNYYICPCDKKEGCASIPWDSSNINGLGNILSCYCDLKNPKQWLVHHFNTEEIKNSIYVEEIKYLNLLKKADVIVPKIIKKMGLNDNTLDFLKETHGIDKEIVEIILTKGSNE